MSAPRSLLLLQEELFKAMALCCCAKRVAQEVFDSATQGGGIDIEACLALVEGMVRSVERHPHALVNTARLKGDGTDTSMHSVAVASLMVALAQQMGHASSTVLEAGVAGFLHDIGKIAISQQILNKPGPLSPLERAEIQKHSTAGKVILTRCGCLNTAILDVCLHHHEKFDGSGYPDGLIGHEISLLSRMATVCDVYDALSAPRPYKKAWGPARTLQAMAGWAGHFDPDVLQCLVLTLGLYPLGTLVRVENDQLAIVVEQNKKLSAPKVIAVWDCSSGRALKPKLTDLSINTSSIVAVEDAEAWRAKGFDLDAVEAQLLYHL